MQYQEQSLKKLQKRYAKSTVDKSKLNSKRYSNNSEEAGKRKQRSTKREQKENKT